MKETTPRRTSGLSDIELILALFLRVGSIVAAGLMAAGLVDMVLWEAQIAPKLITAGIIVLVSTPVMRVMVAGVIFIKERDWRFALFSLVVLLAVILGAVIGTEGG